MYKVKSIIHPKVKNILVIFLDIILLMLASFFSYLMVAENVSIAFPNFLISSFCVAICTILFFFVIHLYSSTLKYFGLVESIKLVDSILAVLVINLLVMALTNYMPLRWCVISSMLDIIFLMASRFSYRIFFYLKNTFSSKKKEMKKVMVIGAGDTAKLLLQEMIQKPSLLLKPVCLIDDDPLKQGLSIEGVMVVGDRNKILESAKKYHVDLIVISILAASKVEISKIISICKETYCHVKIVPSISKMLSKGVYLQNLRDVDVNDLLGRDAIVVDDREIRESIVNKVVLVTGGGGSIGSELSRQIASMQPKKLIIFDIYENNAYDIEQELRKEYPSLDLVVLIGSVRNETRVFEVFKMYRPDIVYHAAAHKHVPLMEQSPCEAVKNNVFGTLNVARASDLYGTKKFVLISTDKAVNPTNVMGATKRICEMIIQSFSSSTCSYVAVRFGNVLGSNGSVIPLFKKQIAQGGPVTVTHKDIIRYFMTIPEAVSLILEASTYAKGKEIFILDMGKPVRIYDLAVNLIRLSGLRENEDIKIITTGLRPGEKLYEELLLSEEGIKKTKNNLIYIAHPIDFDQTSFEENLKTLKNMAYLEDKNIRELIKKIVPTYHEKTN